MWHNFKIGKILFFHFKLKKAQDDKYDKNGSL